jgi:hypothetical protein
MTADELRDAEARHQRASQHASPMTGSLTPAQRRTLEAIQAGTVRHSILAAYATGYSPWTHPPTIRRQTVQRVVDKRLAKVGPHRAPTFVATVELTAAGREALQR